MLKNLISAFLVFRLELRQLPIDASLVLLRWRQHSVIEIVLHRREERREERERLLHRLEEVYPF